MATAETLSQDDIFHLLQCRRRRDALGYLLDHDGAVRMRDLAEQVAAWEHETTVEGLTSTQRQRVYIPLYQEHLPKLDKAGVIDYNQSRGIVEQRPLASTLEPYLGGIPGQDPPTEDAPPQSVGSRETDSRPTTPSDTEHSVQTDDAPARHWDEYYAVASVFGLALVGGFLLELPMVSTLSGVAIGALVSLLFATLTVARLFGVRGASSAQ